MDLQAPILATQNLYISVHYIMQLLLGGKVGFQVLDIIQDIVIEGLQFLLMQPAKSLHSELAPSNLHIVQEKCPRWGKK